jgi:hypothetical protein
VLAARRLDEYRFRVTGCRSDYVASTSGVPEIPDDFLQCPKSAESGQLRTIVGLASKGSWSKDFLVGVRQGVRQH